MSKTDPTPIDGEAREMEPGQLRPCPFCGGDAAQVDIEEGENAGGSCIACQACSASSPVHFDRKENLHSSWNDRARTAPQTEASEEPQFDATEPEQERLAIAFCHEIAGPRGKPGNNPDPVRLLEMARALYKAEMFSRRAHLKIVRAK